MKPFVVWDSQVCMDENAGWREGYIESQFANGVEFDEESITEEEIFDFAVKENQGYLEDMRHILNARETPNGFIAVVDVGRWNGRATGYKEFNGSISDALSASYDEVKWYVDKYGRFCGTFIDHDGTTFSIYRMWRPWVNESQKEMVLDKIYCGEVTERILKRYTLHMGKVVKEALGY